MAADIPTTEPTSFVAGDTVCWTKSLADFPADEYELTYAFVKTGVLLEVTCVADGTDHYAEIDITDSDVAAGVYKWQAYATSNDDTERYLVGAGTCKVFTDFASESSGYDSRTDAEIMLEALTATLKSKATADQLAMSIAGRSLQRMPLEELLKWESHLKAEVRREQAAENAELGLSTGLKVRVRF